MENNNFLPNNLAQPANEEEIDYGRILFLFIQNWHWFVVGIMFALGGAFFYNHYCHQQAYTINTSILIMEDDKGMSLGSMFEKTIMPGRSSVTIVDEIELLRSYTLSHRVFEKLNWRVSCYKKEFFKQKGLYPNEPFIVQEDGKAANIEGLMLYLEPGDDSTYIISAEGTATVNNQPQDIKFRKKGKFGKPFVNEYFHFTLHLKGNDLRDRDTEYCFKFNNINALTKAYLGRQKIEPAGKTSNVIRLTIEGSEPMREIHYLNGLVSEYINQNLEFRTEPQKRSLGFINNQLRGMSDSLNAAGSTVTRFRSQNQVLDISAKGGLVMQQLSEIEKERSQSQMQLDYFRSLHTYLENSDSIKNMVMPSVVGVQDPSLNAVVLKLSDLYSRRAVLSFSTHTNNPTLMLLNNEIDQVTSQLRENLVNLISNAQLNILNLQRREAGINKQLNNLPGKEQQLIDITRQYELTSDIYTYLLQKQAETDITLASTVSNVQVIDPARVERIEPSGISPLWVYLLTFIIGLVLPGIVILGLDALNNTIHLQEDVEKLTPITIIGNVPHSTSASEQVVINTPQAPITEAYRTIRTNLQYMLSQSDQQIIGIHSIRQGEGKSFSSINLACILAVNDKKVLLIGADMRKPRLHQLLLHLSGEGLSTYLIGQSKYEDIIQPTNIKNLWLLTAGPIPPNPAELLERGLFRALLDRARNEFDYIVMDNAPVSIVTDGLVTSQQADLNIFILRYGVSRKDQLKFINDMAAKEVMKHPALIINDIKGTCYGYRYYSYSQGFYSANDKEKTGYHKLTRKLLEYVKRFTNK